MTPLQSFKKSFIQLFQPLSVVERVLLGLWLVIIALMPFHAFLSTWGGTLIGPLEVWKSWKEFLLLILLFTALGWLIKKRQVKEAFSDKLVWLIGAYLLIHIVMALVYRPELPAMAAGFLFNLRFLGMLLLSMVIVRFVKRDHLLRVLLWVVLGGALLVIIFGMLQMLVLPKDFLANFGYGATTIAPYTTLNDNENIIRAMSTLRGPNTFGQYLILVGMILLSLWQRPQLKMFATGGLMATVILLFWSHSRSAWLGAIAATMVFLWLSIKNPLLKKRVFVGAAAGALIAIGAIAVALPQSPALQRAILHTELDDSSLSSTEAHAQSIESSLERVAEYPFGTGPGTAGPASFYSDDPLIPENYYLQLIEEIGFIGLAIFLAICFVVVYRLYLQREQFWPKILLATFAGVMVINVFLHGWADDTMAMMWWGIAGLFMITKK